MVGLTAAARQPGRRPLNDRSDQGHLLERLYHTLLRLRVRVEIDLSSGLGGFFLNSSSSFFLVFFSVFFLVFFLDLPGERPAAAGRASPRGPAAPSRLGAGGGRRRGGRRCPGRW